MNPPVLRGAELLDEIEKTGGDSPALWWLGHSGFALKYRSLLFYVDPCLSTPPGRTRVSEPPLTPEQAVNADLILCTHAHPSHMDPGTLPAMLKASPRVRVVLPKSTAEHACSIGIPYARMTTTDSDLRVEYFKGGLYGRVYSVPSAHPTLDWTPLGGYPHLGYLIRFGDYTIYHAGDCCLYDGIVDRLRPYNVTVALLAIDGNGNFEIAEAAQLAEDIHARWLVPMHYGAFGESAVIVNRFINHMLGFRPSLGFKVFECGERWIIP
ncbi:MAG TPA: MBL fold metallo-hydrolase [Bryobacteraceae bacterium]|jgi:L-ascorbate metabolism protein UlaG (beta-lactamase superfamily)|nr:MBL fold metallo-hydrolase [Bryobacteraceae bacterium]